MGESGLQSLLDKQAITEVLYRFCRGVDRNDEELMLSCYHPGARDSHGIFDGPGDEYVVYLRPVLQSFDSIQHVIGNVLIELDGDLAWSESYVTAYHVQRDEAGTPTQLIVSGRYVDRFERRDDDWRIVDRQFLADWSRVDVGIQEWVGDNIGSPFVSGSSDRHDPSYSRTARTF
jgi:hypothetical protein